MSTDPETLAFYDGAAAQYAGRFGRSAPDTDLRAFMDLLPPGSRVLDFGCGPGNAAAMLRDAGFSVEATDASAGMAALAHEKYVLKVRLEEFADLDAEATYDGIWANFSLLHAPRADMPGHLGRIATALKKGGVLHLGLKEGTGEYRDHLGRFYTYYGEAELRGLLAAAGLAVLTVRRGHEQGMAGTDDPFLVLRARAEPDA